MINDLVLHGIRRNLCKKYSVVDRHRHKIIYNINRSYLATLLPKLQWHTEVYEETFHVNSKMAQTMHAKYLKFTVRNLSLQELAIFGDYQGDFRL